jgi:SAM-dependent methyltransferase
MSSDYLLASDAEGERLRLQARVWEPETERLLEVLAIEPGWSCLDLGCGAMGILGPLSRRTGPGGRVTGVEIDPTLLAAARRYVEVGGLSNVELIEGDVYQVDLAVSAFDLVHERWVLPHVATPAAFLQKMIALAKPGGLIVVQESDQHSWNFFPPAPNWARLKAIIEAGFALRGDINIGRRTYHLLRAAGLENVQIRAAVLALHNSHPYMRLPIIGANAMRPHLLKAGITTDTELADLLAEVEALVADPATVQLTFTLTQVWGQKPVAT